MKPPEGQRRRPNFTGSAVVIVLGLALILTGSAMAVNSPTFGDPLSGLTSSQLGLFLAGQDEFVQEETVADGLGPVFNNTSCANCHSNPAVGGDSNILETRFGRITNGQFDPMPEFGGSLIQSQGIGDADPLSPCHGETVPAEATIRAQRRTTPLFGLGFVDNVPDLILNLLAKAQQLITPAVAGRPHMVTDVATGNTRVGRFGWKAQVATLLTFSGDAYLNEMGVTNPLFPNENAPQGDASLLAICDTVPTGAPADPDDDDTGINAFNDFMTLLAAPARGPITSQVRAGEVVFIGIGCATCHFPALITGPNPVAALNKVTFKPFSDFLLHDMGSLGDGIVQGDASGHEMRTAPLWGLRVRTRFLHDGRATTLQDAILAHEGQGQYARNRFVQLSPAAKASLIAFLNSL